MTFIFSFKAFCFNVQNPIALIEELNTKSPYSFSPPPCLQRMQSSADSRVTPNFKLQACALTLCGPPKNVPSVWSSDSDLSKDFTPNLTKEISALHPLIKAYFDKSAISNDKELKELAAIVKMPNNSPQYSDRDLEELGLMTFGPYLQEVVDPNLDIQHRHHFVIQPPPEASLEFVTGLKEFADLYSHSISTNPAEFATRGLYSPDETYQLAETMIQETESVISRGQSQFSSKEYAVIREMINNIHTGMFDQDSFKERYRTVFENINNLKIYALKKQPNLPLSGPRFACKSSTCGISYQQMFERINPLAALEKLRSKLRDTAFKEQMISRCQSIAARMAIKKTDQAQAEKIYAEALKKIKSTILPRFSAHSKKLLTDYLDGLKIYSIDPYQTSDPKAPNPLTHFKSLLEAEVKFSHQNIFSNTNYESSMIKALKLAANIDSVNPFESSTAICASSTQTLIWDAFYSRSNFESTKKDELFVSHYSCGHTVQGKYFLIHELGHAINYFFKTHKLSNESEATFKKIRSCLHDYYGPSPQTTNAKSTVNFTGDLLTTEEDMADIFSFAADLQIENGELKYCSMLKQNTAKTNYENLSLTLLGDDQHSPDFTRLLFEAVNKNWPLSDSCRSVIEDVRPMINFKKCADF